MKHDGPHDDQTWTVVASAALMRLEDGKETGIIPILKEKISIGRERDNTLMLRGDTKASRNHAIIYREGSSWFVEDLDSKNGVFVNGNKIDKRHELKHSEHISIGLAEFVFQMPNKKN